MGRVSAIHLPGEPTLSGGALALWHKGKKVPLATRSTWLWS